MPYINLITHNMLRGIHLSFIFITLFFNTLISQNNDLKDVDFVLPVDIPVYLSGTFGELRSNHFHSGIDIKTQGTEGKVIRSIGDGWISRIRISTSGYGKAIYITHPGGYVSVYGHLQRFSDSIQRVVVEDQYEKESFKTQMFFDKGEWPVQKGEIIAYSGNTGGSLGPHLHFEIRDEKTQHPLNPLLFDFVKVKDFYRPKITQMAVYPVDETSTINGANDTSFFDLSGWGEGHKIKGDSVIKISGRVSFGIGTYDLMNNVSNKNGVAGVKMFLDTTLIFELYMDRLSFNTTRYINSLIDYPYYTRSKKRLIRTQIDTNNMLGNYVHVQKNGIIELTDTLLHTVNYEIRDIYNNVSKLSFKIVADTSKTIPNNNVPSDSSFTGFFKYSVKNDIKRDSFNVVFPANSFYQSFMFRFDETDCDSCLFSKVYMLHHQSIPVHKYFKIKMVTRQHHDSLSEKLYIGYSADNKDFSYVNSEFDNQLLTSRSRKLGYYKILADTVLPQIVPLNFSDKKSVSNQNNLKLKISDSKTGVKNYRAMLNDKWILMEYDPKKDLLTYNFDSRMTAGKNSFHIIVEDMVGNSAEYKCILYY